MLKFTILIYIMDKLAPLDRSVINMIPIRISREEKVEIIDRIKTYFDEERSEIIGDLAAEQLLDFIAGEMAPHIYNRAIFDARQLINDRFAQIEEDLYTLERPKKAR
jgi:uncharacterized protein (DUF2164 family)